MRGTAALVVLLFHVWQPLHQQLYLRSLDQLQSFDELLLRLVFVVFNGHTAVSVFFVLSGYVLILSLHRDQRSPIATSAAFAARRFFRIYPALAVNLLLMAAVLSLLAIGLPERVPAPTLEQLKKNLLLVDFGVNGATWTMQVEFFAIPILLLGYGLYRLFGLGGVLALAGFNLLISLRDGQFYALLPFRDTLFSYSWFPHLYTYVLHTKSCSCLAWRWLSFGGVTCFNFDRQAQRRCWYCHWLPWQAAGCCSAIGPSGGS